MQISNEGKIGLALGLVALAGAGAIVVAHGPIVIVIGWLLIAIAFVGGVLLAHHHFERRRMIPLIGMFAFGLGFIGCAAWYFWPRPPVAQSISQAIPIVVSRIGGYQWTRSGGFTDPGALQFDYPVWTFNPVYITNLSTKRSLTLDIVLLRTFQNGTTMQYRGDGKTTDGKLVGTDQWTLKYIKPRDPYLLSPVKLAPNESKNGTFVFVDFAPIAANGPGGPDLTKEKYAIELTDVVTGNVINIPVGSGYRGAPE